MKLCLIQEKQNRLYDFADTKRIFPLAEVEKLQGEMIEQNFTLMEDAVHEGEFILSSEAINFCGLPGQLDFPLWDFLERGYKPLTERLFQFAGRKNVWIAVGLYRPAPGGAVYNSVLVINRRGDLVTIYDKIHLAGSEKDYLAAGNRFCCFDTEFGRIGLCICWDMQFPELCRILALRGARIVLCPTWGWERIYAGSRAYENGVYVAGAMAVPYGGQIEGIRSPSGVFDPEGELVVTGYVRKAEVVAFDIDLHKEWDIHRIRMEGRRPELYRSLADEGSYIRT
jgi:predicted amidohydrolase